MGIFGAIAKDVFSSGAKSAADHTGEAATKSAAKSFENRAAESDAEHEGMEEAASEAKQSMPGAFPGMEDEEEFAEGEELMQSPNITAKLFNEETGGIRAKAANMALQASVNYPNVVNSAIKLGVGPESAALHKTMIEGLNKGSADIGTLTKGGQSAMAEFSNSTIGKYFMGAGGDAEKTAAGALSEAESAETHLPGSFPGISENDHFESPLGKIFSGSGSEAEKTVSGAKTSLPGSFPGAEDDEEAVLSAAGHSPVADARTAQLTSSVTTASEDDSDAESLSGKSSSKFKLRLKSASSSVKKAASSMKKPFGKSDGVSAKPLGEFSTGSKAVKAAKIASPDVKVKVFTGGAQAKAMNKSIQTVLNNPNSTNKVLKSTLGEHTAQLHREAATSGLDIDNFVKNATGAAQEWAKSPLSKYVNGEKGLTTVLTDTAAKVGKGLIS